MTAGTAPVRVLIVDDEPAILRFLRVGLGSQLDFIGAYEKLLEYVSDEHGHLACGTGTLVVKAVGGEKRGVPGRRKSSRN